MLFTSITTFAFLAPAALAAALPARQDSYLPACSMNSTTPCSCPPGTAYAQSVTFAVIGAAATDVKDLISDFYDAPWFGVTYSPGDSPNNEPGASIRSASLTTAVGTYTFSERLTKLKSTYDGSFIQKFELLPSTTPIEYTSGNGSFGGWWVTLESTSVFQYETALRWSNYACVTGNPLDYALFHESGLANATSILEAEGKILGTNVEPYSIQSF